MFQCHGFLVDDQRLSDYSARPLPACPLPFVFTHLIVNEVARDAN
jgi:hypothetical protein